MSEVQRWLRLLEQKNKKDKFLSDTIYQTSEGKKEIESIIKEYEVLFYIMKARE